MKFVLLINLKLWTIANYFSLKIAEHEHFSANKCENANFVLLAFSYLLAEKISCSAELSMKKVFITSGPGPNVLFAYDIKVLFWNCNFSGAVSNQWDNICKMLNMITAARLPLTSKTNSFCTKISVSTDLSKTCLMIDNVDNNNILVLRMITVD